MCTNCSCPGSWSCKIRQLPIVKTTTTRILVWHKIAFDVEASGLKHWGLPFIAITLRSTSMAFFILFYRSHSYRWAGCRSYGSRTWPIKWNAVSSRQLSYWYCSIGVLHWTLTKRLEKKLDGNYTRMQRAIIEQALAATPHKTPTIRPPASHHEKYPS